MRLLVLGILLTTATFAQALEVAFLEVVRPNGSLLTLEPGGRFAHTLIRYKGQWLHSHPNRDSVELIDDLAMFGDHVVILQEPNLPEPSEAVVKQWLGKPFDFSFDWNSTESTYCTKLVAQILGVSPRLMDFEMPLWDQLSLPVQRGSAGLSPDELFGILLTRGYIEKVSCRLDLEQ